jgi:hypothetical protein
MISTFSAWADFAGSIAGAVSAFQTAAAGEVIVDWEKTHGTNAKISARTKTAL